MEDGYKQCNGPCGKIKLLDEFYFDNSCGKYSGKCKVCRCAQQKEYSAKHKEERSKYNEEYYKKNKDNIGIQVSAYYKKNKNKILTREKEYRKNNPEKIKERDRKKYEKRKPQVLKQSKIYYQKNKEDIKQKSKKYREDNPERVAEQKKRYRIKNIDKIRKYDVERKKIKYKNDINFRISENIRKRLNKIMRGKIKAGSAVRDLGCSIKELKMSLASQFYPHPKTGEKMTWENYGKAWHIDHILPLSFFNLTDREEFLVACHWSNLAPMWAQENLKKGGANR